MDGWFSLNLVPLPVAGAPTIHHSYFNDPLDVSAMIPGFGSCREEKSLMFGEDLLSID
jgi:hypothetical protein